MRAVLLIAVLAVAVPDRPAPKPRVEEPTPQRQILGDWQQEKVGGNVLPPNLTTIWRITPTESIFLVNGKVSTGDGLTAAYTIDWTKNPVAIDFMPHQRGGKMVGILKLDGDRLILALRTAGTNRPTDFNNADLVVHHKRAQ